MKHWLFMINGLSQSWICHKHGLKQSQPARTDFVMLFEHGPGIRLICAWPQMDAGRMEERKHRGSHMGFWKEPGFPTPSTLFSAHTNPIHTLSNPSPPVLGTIHAGPASMLIPSHPCHRVPIQHNLSSQFSTSPFPSRLLFILSHFVYKSLY